MADGFNFNRRKSSTAAPWDKSILSSKSSRDSGRKILIKGKFLCLVTGAGNGLGRAIAGMVFQDHGILPNAMSGSKVILIDNDEEALKETSGKKMRQFLKHRKIEVELEIADLSDLREMKELIDRIDGRISKDFEHVIFVNNASTLADVTKEMEEIDEPTEMEKYWNLNITSRVFLSSQFCRIFEQSKRTVVHVVRADSAKPTAFLGPSCMATSAIQTFATTLARENPKVRVLHFQVGYLDTARTRKIINNCGNEELKDFLTKLCEENKLEIPLEAAKTMIKYIEGDEYKSGEVLIAGKE